MIEALGKAMDRIVSQAIKQAMLGIYPDLSNEAYHKDPAISRSGIMMFRESPYKFWAEYLNPNRPPKRSTPAMELGTAFHTMILEPEKFDEEYVIKLDLQKAPKKVLLKDVGREAFEAYKAKKNKIALINEQAIEEFETRFADRKILNLEEWYVLQEMKTAIENHAEAKELIEGAIYEQSYFWKDKGSGLILKARPDILHSNIIGDLKTCLSANSRAYQRVMTDSGYHIQGAIIREAIREVEGRDIPNVINICIEKHYPHEIGIKIISEKALDEGERIYKNTLLEMKSAFENNYFPSYEPETVELPAWANV